ncbi:MAG: PEGA domain-containing protein [Patescibacteria group bacterium]|nr:PEGA domain-containing protein [Candidatus Beckwithbacteria bacterium]MDZ4228918.1 PEGA domain-containing protein [Patescibacteria group bacterium]
MKKLWPIVLVAVVVGLIFLGRNLLAGRKKAALSVNTTPRASVFLDGEHLGQTPYYSEVLKAGEFVLKIVPESTGQALTPWEGRVSLAPGILTVVNRELGLTQDDSSGEILSFEPLADKNTVSVSVVTTPDGAVVNLDGEPRGFAPLTLDNVTEGDHILLVSSPGFKERTIKAKTVKGHKLIASVQLGRETVTPPTDEAAEEATPSASPQVSPSPTGLPTPTASPIGSPKPTSSPKVSAKPYVQVLKDPGWVRVRTGTGTNFDKVTDAEGNEVKVYYPDQLPLLDEEKGWYKIEYETGKNGWIAGQYAEKFE